MAEDAVNGLYQQGLLGRRLKYGAEVALAQVFAVANKDGPEVRVLMVDELLKLMQDSSLQFVRQDQLVVTHVV